MSRKQVSLEEQAQGYVLACRSLIPRTNLVFEVAVGEEHEAKVYKVVKPIAEVVFSWKNGIEDKNCWYLDNRGETK